MLKLFAALLSTSVLYNYFDATIKLFSNLHPTKLSDILIKLLFFPGIEKVIIIFIQAYEQGAK